jgi:transcription termination/antitermination protein NusA
MSRIIFDGNHIKFISLFQSITRVVPKDMIPEEDKLTFVVQDVMLSKAIGKQGANVKKLEKSLKRKIKIVGFNPNLLRFVKNLLYPMKIQDLEESEGVITIIAPDSQTRGHIIGRNAQQLRQTEAIVQRYFKYIKEIKVK